MHIILTGPLLFKKRIDLQTCNLVSFLHLISDIATLASLLFLGLGGVVINEDSTHSIINYQIKSSGFWQWIDFVITLNSSNKHLFYSFWEKFPNSTFFHLHCTNENNVPTPRLFQLHSYLGAHNKYVMYWISNLELNLI